MVEIRVFVEGGCIESGFGDIAVAGGSTALRQSINELISQKITNETVSVVVDLKGPVSNAVTRFKNDKSQDANLLLLIDLDGPENLRQKRLCDNGLEAYSDDVFFMIQEMEAWILSQIDGIERFLCRRGYTRRRENEDILDYPRIRNIEFIDIDKPSIVLKDILMHYFKKKSDGKKMKYRKVIDAADFIGHLDATTLCGTFSDFDRLVTRISAIASASV